MKRPGDDISRENLDGSVEVADIAVVETTSGLDLVLGVSELILQGKKILVCLQIGIRLGDGKDGLECAGE